ncbi:hypothetical protein F5884DRAFT_657656 [Xylogone sp. PMI_703]|nr:hypothetical protein F5884DRAFT_657656 [Xylogone sp. PMI_703]
MPPSSPAPPDKRLCVAPSSTTTTLTSPATNDHDNHNQDYNCNSNNVPTNIQSILDLSEEAVLLLRKKDLRAYFLALQRHVLHPPQPEIRSQIYHLLLPPPVHPPVRGPHPRRLQSHIHLSQPFPPSILLVCHQTLHEALPIFYGNPTQTIFITIDYNVWDHKIRRSELVTSTFLTSCIRNVHLSVHLGSEKRASRPDGTERDARLVEVAKGVKKLRSWLAGADLQVLTISWQEPPQTFSWEQKKLVLDALRPLRARKVQAGEINWGLKWNKGRRFRFEIDYLEQLQRASETRQSPIESHSQTSQQAGIVT